MALASARIEQHIENSSQLADSKLEDGVRSQPTDQSLPLAKAPGAIKPGNFNHRRSLLPRKTAPSNSRSTGGLQEDVQHRSAFVGSNPLVGQDPFSDPNVNKKLIPPTTTEKESLSSSNAQKVPVKNLERPFSAKSRGIAGRSLPISRTTHSKIVSVSSGLQSSTSAGFGRAISSTKRDSASALDVSSICSDTPNSSIKYLKYTAARTKIRPESQFGPSSEGALGHHRTNSHQIAKDSIFKNIPSQPKDALFHKLPIKVKQSPPSARQQDFTAEKSSKSATVSFANSPSVVPEPEMSLDQIFRLQMELMQLCDLRRIAGETNKRWEQSAEQILHHWFDDIRKELHMVEHLIQAQKVSEAQAALISWRGNMTSAEVAVKVQLLSRNISDTWQLTNPDGEYTRLIRVFEEWFDRARSVQSSRKQSIQLKKQEINIIEPIEDVWAHEAENMESRLNSSLRGLEHVGEVLEKTDFGHILSSFKKLLRNSLKEINMIRAIQTNIMAAEISWIQTCIDNMTQAEMIILDDDGVCEVAT